MTTRDEMRKVFYDAWRKHKENRLVEPLESMIIDIILMHPEYHALFDSPENLPEVVFKESNPFLHISLHLAIREQISTDSPQGIRLVYESLCKKFHDKHLAEHRMLDSLGQILWDAQQTGSLPDEQYYLEILRRIE
jgi:hypothetical protein